MADKGSSRRPAGQDLEASSPDRIRNVVLVGPGGSGKTTLVETLLASAGAVPRAGSVREGTTVCDFEESEQRPRALGLARRRAARPRRHQGQPGRHPRVRRLRRRAARRAARRRLRAVRGRRQRGRRRRAPARCGASAPTSACRARSSITKLDQARADYEGVLGQAQAAFGDKVMPLYLPVREGGEVVSRSTGLLAPGDADATPRSCAAQLIEGVIEESEDETLMDRYLGGEEIDEKVLDRRPRAGGRPGDVLPRRPRLLGDRRRLHRAARPAVRGVPVAAGAPAPARVHARRRHRRADHLRPRRPAGGRGRQDDERPVRRPAQPGPRLLRHAAARRVGARVRPLHVVLRRGLRPRRPRRGRADRRARLPVRQAPRSPATQVVAGDLCAIGRLTRAETGDTLSSVERPAGADAVVAARAAAAGRDRRRRARPTRTSCRRR